MTDDIGSEASNLDDEEPSTETERERSGAEAKKDDPELLIEELTARLESRGKRIKVLERDLAKAARKIKELENDIEQKAETIEEKEKEMERAKKETKRETAQDVVQMFFEVRDNLVRALDQDEGANIRPGVDATLTQFDDLLTSQGINIINPTPGEDVVPTHHEVIDTVEGEQPDGRIEKVFRHGYATDKRVIRPAQVIVSEGSNEPVQAEGDIASTEETDG